MLLTRCLVVIVFIIIICFRHRLFVRSRWYYLVWESFSRSDHSFWSMSGPRRNSPSDESRTHIQPFIRTRLRKPAGSSRVTSRPFTLALLPQDICCDITLPLGGPGRSWCWCPKGQVWPRPASRLFTTLLVAPLPVAFLCRAWRHSFRSTTTRFGKALVCK